MEDSSEQEGLQFYSESDTESEEEEKVEEKKEWDESPKTEQNCTQSSAREEWVIKYVCWAGMQAKLTRD